MTYQDHIASLPPCGDSSVEAFMRDLGNDRYFPSVRTWKAVEAYLLAKNADESMIAAAQSGWLSYERMLSH